VKSIIEETPAVRCYECGRYGILQKHHIFGGADRKKSEKYGLTVHLCPDCHVCTPQAVHNNRRFMVRLRQIGQREFESQYSHEKFMKEFGRNYL